MEKLIDILKEEGIKFPFKDKDWMNKFGIYCGISIIPALIVSMLVFTFLIPYINMIGLGLFILLIPVFVVLQIYLNGYTLELIRNVKNKIEDNTPLHNEIPNKFKLGLIQLILALGPILLGMILIMISTGILVGGIYLTAEINLVLGIILIIIGGVLGLASILATLFLATIIIPSMIYIFLETNSIRDAYNIQNIRLVVKNAWKEFLLLYGLSLIGSMLISMFSNIPCIGIFALALGASYIAFVIAFMTGKIFLELENKVKIK